MALEDTIPDLLRKCKRNILSILFRLDPKKMRRSARQTLVKRIEVLGHPGSEKRGQAHADLTAFGTMRAAADLASDDQRAHTALRQIVVLGLETHPDGFAEGLSSVNSTLGT